MCGLDVYLNQFISTRDLNVENVVNTESAGVGVRVIANGAYGFAASNDMSPDSIATAARQAVAIAKANAKLQTEPVRLAAVKGSARSVGQRRSRKTGVQCQSKKKWNCC